MKKCPSCQKTYDDHLKFCQKDGTALVSVAEEAPIDPYKTMVASNIAPPESVEETKEEPVEQSTVVENTPAKAVPTAPPAVDEDEEDVLEIPPKKEESDPMKTIAVSGGSTSDNIKIPDLPEPPAEAAVDPEPDSSPAFNQGNEDATIISPEIPVFAEPKIEPPDLSGALPDPPVAAKEPEVVQEPELPQEPEPSPELPQEAEPTAEPEFEDPQADSKPSLPIPSPFEESMPPGFALPETPPFEHPLGHVPEEQQAASPPASPFTDPVAPEASAGPEDWDVGSGGAGTDLDAFADNKIAGASLSDADVEGENKTLAYVSLGTGVLSVLCCLGGILIGPIAVIIGFMAKNKIKADPSVYGGGTFATFGMVLGILGAILSVIVILLNVFSTMMNSGAF